MIDKRGFFYISFLFFSNNPFNEFGMGKSLLVVYTISMESYIYMMYHGNIQKNLEIRKRVYYEELHINSRRRQ